MLLTDVLGFGWFVGVPGNAVQGPEPNLYSMFTGVAGGFGGDGGGFP